MVLEKTMDTTMWMYYVVLEVEEEHPGIGGVLGTRWLARTRCFLVGDLLKIIILLTVVLCASRTSSSGRIDIHEVIVKRRRGLMASWWQSGRHGWSLQWYQRVLRVLRGVKSLNSIRRELKQVERLLGRWCRQARPNGATLRDATLKVNPKP